MGGVLRYKWEAYHDTHGRGTETSGLGGTENTAIEIGAYRGRRNYYSINSQELHGCNAAHYSHVINSPELQDWNCNCNCNPN